MRTLRIGTRGSALALAQAGLVAEALARATGAATELVPIRTRGDDSRAPLTEIGGQGVFVAAVRAAVLDGTVDLAVHSFKDLPTGSAPGLAVAAVPPRADPRDALCSAGGFALAALPRGAAVGTGAPRRIAQLRRARPDLDLVPVRGNVDTRLRLVTDGPLDAVVLAAAGLQRLGRAGAITELLAPDVVLPAPAQGALAVECRADNAESAWYASALAALDDPPSRAAAIAERALLAALEAGCTAPVGALGRAEGSVLVLTAAVTALDGSSDLRATEHGTPDAPTDLGYRLAQMLLDRGAAGLLGHVGAEQ